MTLCIDEQEQSLKDFLQLPQNKKVLEAQQRKELAQSIKLRERQQASDFQQRVSHRLEGMLNVIHHELEHEAGLHRYWRPLMRLSKP